MDVIQLSRKKMLVDSPGIMVQSERGPLPHKHQGVLGESPQIDRQGVDGGGRGNGDGRGGGGGWGGSGGGSRGTPWRRVANTYCPLSNWTQVTEKCGPQGWWGGT